MSIFTILRPILPGTSWLIMSVTVARRLSLVIGEAINGGDLFGFEE